MSNSHHELPTDCPDSQCDATIEDWDDAMIHMLYHV